MQTDDELVWMPEADEPDLPRCLLAAALTLIAAGVTAALLLTAPHPTASYDIDAALASVEHRTAAAMRAVGNAAAYPQLAEAADEVQAALVEVRDATRHTDEIGDAGERRIVRHYLDHARTLLTRLSAITSLPDSELHRWGPWPRRRPTP